VNITSEFNEVSVRLSIDPTSKFSNPIAR